MTVVRCWLNRARRWRCFEARLAAVEARLLPLHLAVHVALGNAAQYMVVEKTRQNGGNRGQMKRIWSAIVGFFRRVGGGQVGDILTRLTEQALPIAEAIAKATPFRTDDEVVALLRSYDRPDLWDDQRDRNEILRALAIAVLRDAAKLPLATRWYAAAVETALVIIESRERSQD